MSKWREKKFDSFKISEGNKSFTASRSKYLEIPFLYFILLGILAASVTNLGSRKGTRASTPCAVYPCPNLRPCPTHRPKPFAGARSAGEYGSKWRALSLKYLSRHRTCEVCGAPSVITDHITPRGMGGEDKWENCQALCKRCHASKSGREARAMRKSA